MDRSMFGNSLLHHAVPGPAVRAFAYPSGGFVPAGLAEVDGFCFVWVEHGSFRPLSAAKIQNCIEMQSANGGQFILVFFSMLVALQTFFRQIHTLG
jgi:hypothetical protein